MDIASADARIRDLDRRLDHGQREALDAVAEDGEIASFDLEQLRVDRRHIRVVTEQFAQLMLRIGKQLFVVPQRVVAIESDHQFVAARGLRRSARVSRRSAHLVEP